jgi:hypothetical protein
MTAGRLRVPGGAPLRRKRPVAVFGVGVNEGSGPRAATVAFNDF